MTLRRAVGTRCPDRRRGFTLIEMLITVAIVAILASVALPMAQLEVKRGKEQELRSALSLIRSAIDSYKQAVDEGHITHMVGQSGYPPTLDDLVDGVVDIKDPDKKKIYFLRRLPRDPLVSDPTLGADQTWGKRSYESGPNDPQEGADVFDVYPLSDDVGLNGIPYRKW